MGGDPGYPGLTGPDLQNLDPFAHFAQLVKAIDSFVRTTHAPYPVERTLLTTGVLDAAMSSHSRRGERIETPELEVKYAAPADSGFLRGSIADV